MYDAVSGLLRVLHLSGARARRAADRARTVGEQSHQHNHSNRKCSDRAVPPYALRRTLRSAAPCPAAARLPPASSSSPAGAAPSPASAPSPAWPPSPSPSRGPSQVPTCSPAPAPGPAPQPGPCQLPGPKARLRGRLVRAPRQPPRILPVGLRSGAGSGGFAACSPLGAPRAHLTKHTHPDVRACVCVCVEVRE